MAKVTKREMLTEIAEVLEGIEGTEDLVAFVEKEKGLLDKRASKPRAMTQTQKDNEALKSVIVTQLTGTTGVTATDIATGMDISVQKASQLLRQLVQAGSVTRVEGKGKEKTTFLA